MSGISMDRVVLGGVVRGVGYMPTLVCRYGGLSRNT
jgi:hypothetical protein